MHSQIKRPNISPLIRNTEIYVLYIATLFETIIFSALIPLTVYSSQIKPNAPNVLHFWCVVSYFYVNKSSRTVMTRITKQQCRSFHESVYEKLKKNHFLDTIKFLSHDSEALVRKTGISFQVVYYRSFGLVENLLNKSIRSFSGLSDKAGLFTIYFTILG